MTQLKNIFPHALILGLSLFSCSTNHNNEPMKQHFDTYMQAVRQHDIEEILSLMDDDFQLHFTEFGITMAKNDMPDVLGWDKAVSGSVTFGNLQVEGDTVSAIFTEKNEFFRLLGIDSLQAEVTYTFNENGKLIKQTYTPLPIQPDFQQPLQAVIDWAKKNRPEELEAIYPNGQMVFNEKMGRRWVALLKEWEAQE